MKNSNFIFILVGIIVAYLMFKKSSATSLSGFGIIDPLFRPQSIIDPLFHPQGIIDPLFRNSKQSMFRVH